jgi:hypothetical protein
MAKRQVKKVAAKQPSKAHFRLGNLFESAASEEFIEGTRLQHESTAKDGVPLDQKSLSGHQF